MGKFTHKRQYEINCRGAISNVLLSVSNHFRHLLYLFWVLVSESLKMMDGMTLLINCPTNKLECVFVVTVVASTSYFLFFFKMSV